MFAGLDAQMLNDGSDCTSVQLSAAEFKKKTGPVWPRVRKSGRCCLDHMQATGSNQPLVYNKSTGLLCWAHINSLVSEQVASEEPRSRLRSRSNSRHRSASRQWVFGTKSDIHLMARTELG